MKKKIRELRDEILRGETKFLDIVVEQMKETKILYSDNFGSDNKEMQEEFSKLESLMQLMHAGSKHSLGESCRNGFTRIVEHKGAILKLVYMEGPENFVIIESLDKIEGRVPVVTLELLQIRIAEAEELKDKLREVTEKYRQAGLTPKEITKYFVEIMQEDYQ